MKSSKNIRTLDIYTRLCEGKIINKPEEAKHFGVDERSIQRVIDDIRAFLDERRISRSSDDRKIEYDRTKKGFVLTGEDSPLMSNSEILAVSKILLASRAFTKREIGSILKKLIGGCVPLKNMQMVKELLSNERFHYVELHHKSGIQDKLWNLGAAIQKQNLIEITYSRAEHTEAVSINTAILRFSILTELRHTEKREKSSGYLMQTGLRKGSSAKGFSLCMPGS